MFSQAGEMEFYSQQQYKEVPHSTNKVCTLFCLYICVNDTHFGVTCTCMISSCFCLNGPCIVNIQLSFMKKITAEQFLEKKFGKESLQYNTFCKRNTFYMKWMTDLRVKIDG